MNNIYRNGFKKEQKEQKRLIALLVKAGMYRLEAKGYVMTEPTFISQIEREKLRGWVI